MYTYRSALLYPSIQYPQCFHHNHACNHSVGCCYCRDNVPSHRYVWEDSVSSLCVLNHMPHLHSHLMSNRLFIWIPNTQHLRLAVAVTKSIPTLSSCKISNGGKHTHTVNQHSLHCTLSAPPPNPPPADTVDTAPVCAHLVPHQLSFFPVLLA